MSELRSELRNFAVLQEAVLRVHDVTKGQAWRDCSPQVLVSRLVEEMGEVVSHLFGDDPVCDFLIASLRDHVETSGVDLDYDPVSMRRELADVANFCMMLSERASDIDPRAPSPETT